jgi:transcriptional regulator with XRE-family HTH domain
LQNEIFFKNEAVMEDFSNWLIEEMEKRGWSTSELARQARIAQSTISLNISGKRKPGIDFCVGVARAFKIPPEVVLRKAGRIPDVEGIEAKLFEELRTYVENLSPEGREELLRYVIFLYKSEIERQQSDPKSEKGKIT